MEPFEINFTITKSDYTFIHEHDIEEKYNSILAEHPEFDKNTMIDSIVDGLLGDIYDYATAEYNGEIEFDSYERFNLFDIVEDWLNDHWDSDDHTVMVDGQLLLFDPDDMPR